MSIVGAQITTSVDGYVAGPGDGPGCGLGIGGERLHYWVFGRRWTYDDEPTSGGPTGADKELLDEGFAAMGAVIGGRNTYAAAEAWGGSNPFPFPMFILTHRTADAPPAESGFTFVDGLDAALARARAAAGGKVVGIMGGADVIRQALAAGYVDELTITVSPVVLGGGKRLFDGFERSLDLEQTRAVQSDWVTHLTYRVLR